jgi:peptide chain release factor subunit 1
VLTKQHFRAVADRLDERFRSEGYDLLMVGGQQHEVPGFVEQLPQHLRDRLAGTFPVDPDHIGPNWIRQHAGELLAEYTATEQRRRVTEVVETRAAGGRAALGLHECLWAGALAAINSLLVEDGAVQPGAVCDNCGWMTSLEEDVPSECPRCANPVRVSADILDELVERVIEEGGSITHVTAATELEKELVVALLRFELPPPP